MKSDKNALNFVLTLPLKVEQWQGDLLNQRYELLKKIYNFAQKRLVRQYYYLIKMKKYNKCKSNKAKEDFFKENIFHFKESGHSPISFTKFGIQNYVCQLLKLYVAKDTTYKKFGLNTWQLLESVASPIWSAWNKIIYGNGKKIHFKKYGELNLIKTNRCKKDNGYSFFGFNLDFSNMILSFNVNGERGQKKKVIHLKIDVKKFTAYEQEALSGGIAGIKQLGIVRREIRGKYKYYLQLTIEGVAPYKNRHLGKGTVGLDLGPSELAVCSNTKLDVIKLGKSYAEQQRLLRLIQRKMDRSRRATNPNKYTETGEINQDNTDKWIRSNNYKKLARQYREIYRQLSEVRKLKQIEIANRLLSLGSAFIIENNNVSGWAKRSKETKKNKKGKYMSKKRFGRSITNNAPAQLIAILKNKVISRGGLFKEVPTIIAATQFDFTNKTFTKHDLKERRITLSNGNTHHRDLLAAFNLQHAVVKQDDKEYKEKDVDNFNVPQMYEDYEHFCELEQNEN